MRRRAGGAFAYLPEFAYIRLSKKRIMIKNLVFDFGGIIADFEFSRALAAFERVGLKNPAEYLDSYHQRGFFRELESGRIGADEFVRRPGRARRGWGSSCCRFRSNDWPVWRSCAATTGSMC